MRAVTKSGGAKITYKRRWCGNDKWQTRNYNKCTTITCKGPESYSANLQEKEPSTAAPCKPTYGYILTWQVRAGCENTSERRFQTSCRHCFSEKQGTPLEMILAGSWWVLCVIASPPFSRGFGTISMTATTTLWRKVCCSSVWCSVVGGVRSIAGNPTRSRINKIFLQTGFHQMPSEFPFFRFCKVQTVQLRCTVRRSF
jgi:hypothetical protein